MRRLNSPVRCHLRFQLDYFIILLPWMCGLVCLVFLRSGNSETIILGSYSLWEVRTSKHAKQLTFSECVFYKWYFFFFLFICTVVLLTCHHSDWGEKSCHFIIYSLSTYRSSCFPPFFCQYLKGCQWVILVLRNLPSRFFSGIVFVVVCDGSAKWLT